MSLYHALAAVHFRLPLPLPLAGEGWGEGASKRGKQMGSDQNSGKPSVRSAQRPDEILRLPFLRTLRRTSPLPRCPSVTRTTRTAHACAWAAWKSTYSLNSSTPSKQVSGVHRETSILCPTVRFGAVAKPLAIFESVENLEFAAGSATIFMSLYACSPLKQCGRSYGISSATRAKNTLQEAFLAGFRKQAATIRTRHVIFSRHPCTPLILLDRVLLFNE